MNLLSTFEKNQMKRDVEEIIRTFGQKAKHLRKKSEENLYGTDDTTFEELGTFSIEFNEIPPEDLNQKIDATGSVLSDLDIRAEDHVQIKNEKFRVQTVNEQNSFGIIAIKTLNW